MAARPQPAFLAQHDTSFEHSPSLALMFTWAGKGVLCRHRRSCCSLPGFCCTSQGYSRHSGLNEEPRNTTRVMQAAKSVGNFFAVQSNNTRFFCNTSHSLPGTFQKRSALSPPLWTLPTARSWFAHPGTEPTRFGLRFLQVSVGLFIFAPATGCTERCLSQLQRSTQAGAFTALLLFSRKYSTPEGLWPLWTLSARTTIGTNFLQRHIVIG